MTQAAIQGHTYANGVGANLSLAVPSGAANGLYMLAAITGAFHLNLTPPSGWTEVGETHGSVGDSITLYSHIYDSVHDTVPYVWVGTSNPTQGVLLTISNFNYATPLDGVSGNHNDFSTTLQPGSLTPSFSDDLAIAFGKIFATTGGPYTFTAPGSWTEDFDTANGSEAMEMIHQALSATTALNPTFTGSAGTYHMAALMALVHTGAGSPPAPTLPKGTLAGQVAALVVYGGAAVPPPRSSGIAALVVYAPRPSKFAEVGQEAALVVYAGDAASALVPRTSQVAALVVWGIAPPGAEARTRAWTFTLDGHLFYVLDLGQEGTFLYDIGTSQWCKFSTDGYVGWNVRIGTMWGDGNRIVGGDTFNSETWELDPDLTTDEGFRDIFHVATGGMMTRTRTYLGVEALRIAGSLGDLGSDAVVSFQMRFSDDQEATWSAYYTVELAPGDFTGEIAWRSLGSFMAPGRVFEFSDFGGLKRIDGADVFIEDFDDIGTKYAKQYGVFE